jgi:penicillin-binding protein 1C
VQALRQQLAELQGRNVEDGAVVVLDNRQRRRCWPGWGPTATAAAAAQVDGVLARRQPGSTLKPFVYGLAFERRLITPASLLDDSPAEIATAAGPVPAAELRPRLQGSGQRAHGAGRQPERAGGARGAACWPPDALHGRLNALGLDLKESGGWYGASLALGSADVTLLAPGQRLPHAGQRRAVHTARHCRAVPAAAARRVAIGREPRFLVSRHPGRQQRPRAHLRAGQPACAHAALRR